MKPTAARSIVQLALVTYLTQLSVLTEAAPVASAGLAESLRARIRAHHAGAATNGEVLHVVYFRPSDAAVAAGRDERLTRVLLDIKDFYDAELARNGFAGCTLPLQMTNGLVRIFDVQGGSPGSSYSYEYADGKRIRAEVAAALRGQLDLDQDFVLILCDLCDKRADGSYFFHSPYYGSPGADNRAGLCYAADCELQDPRWLTETNRTIAYAEHYGKYQQTLADFNTKYLGGIAHELGHALGLPHNRELPAETRRLGSALMGSGNHTYRRERWSDQKGSFLTLASSLRLATHPLFTQSDRARAVPVALTVSNLHFTAAAKSLQIEGRVESNVEVVALIAYSDPEGRSNYDATTWVAAVRNGAFTNAILQTKPGTNELRLAFCHINGAVSTISLNYHADAAGHPDAGELNGEWLVQQAQSAFLSGAVQRAAAIAKSGVEQGIDASSAAKLRHLLELAAGSPPVDLAFVATNVAFLSDVAWASASVGWGKPARNQYYFDAQIQDALFLEPGGVFRGKGLYAHAPARYVFDLKKRWKRFEAVAGLQAGVPDVGSAIFVIKGDGRTLYQSARLKGVATETISVDVADVETLELLTETGKPDNACCWAVWGEPVVRR